MWSRLHYLTRMHPWGTWRECSICTMVITIFLFSSEKLAVVLWPFLPQWTQILSKRLFSPASYHYCVIMKVCCSDYTYLLKWCTSYCCYCRSIGPAAYCGCPCSCVCGSSQLTGAGCPIFGWTIWPTARSPFSQHPAGLFHQLSSSAHHQNVHRLGALSDFTQWRTTPEAGGCVCDVMWCHQPHVGEHCTHSVIFYPVRWWEVTT